MTDVLLLAAALAAGTSLDADIKAVAALPGEPHVFSAAGVTRSETRLLTIENPSPFDIGAKRRLVVVGGLDGDERGVRAAIDVVRWFKTKAPAALRETWTLSALPSADPDGLRSPGPSVRRPGPLDPAPPRAAFQFPPEKGFFGDGERPESRYVWRWIAFQAPDLVIELRGGDEVAPGSLAAAFAASNAAGLGSVRVAAASAAGGPPAIEKLLAASAGAARSPLHDALAKRIARDPLEIARVLARRYPETPAISYIPSVAWVNTLRLAAVVGDDSLGAKVRRQTAPWVSGERKPFGDRIQLTSVAGTMIFAELAKEDASSAAQALAVEGASLASAQKSGGIAEYGQGWTDDMFMATAILARAGATAGRERDLDTAGRLLVEYAARLQRADGIFVHAADGPVAWGRGNGFAALGVMEALTALPARHPARSSVLTIYRRQMQGLTASQAPDGMWRQVIDEPGSYRELTATAMILSAMARGIRLGWIDKASLPIVERAWRALSAHIADEGTLVDVCASTGAGPTKRYYLDRPAISGADDRGGAMALLAAMEIHELMSAGK